jgi:hypothetical protein
MNTVTVNQETLQKLLDYITEAESISFYEWVENGNAPEAHVYALASELQDCVNSQA